MCGPEPWNFARELEAELVAKGWHGTAYLMAEAYAAERIMDGESLAAVLQSIPESPPPRPW